MSTLHHTMVCWAKAVGLCLEINVTVVNSLCVSVRGCRDTSVHEHRGHRHGGTLRNGGEAEHRFCVLVSNIGVEDVAYRLEGIID